MCLPWYRSTTILIVFKLLRYCSGREPIFARIVPGRTAITNLAFVWHGLGLEITWIEGTEDVVHAHRRCQRSLVVVGPWIQFATKSLEECPFALEPGSDWHRGCLALLEAMSRPHFHPELLPHRIEREPVEVWREWRCCYNGLQRGWSAHLGSDLGRVFSGVVHRSIQTWTEAALMTSTQTPARNRTAVHVGHSWRGLWPCGSATRKHGDDTCKVFTGRAARLWKFAAMTMLETFLLVFITCNRDCQFAP